jgi:hypothetical protein
MAKFFISLFVCLAALSVAAQAQRSQTTTTPVPILKQVNRVNEDGSYTYGYENADGSYKIETRDVNGQVQGKYGYYDDTGMLREIEYGASKAGFHPQGTGVKPPVAAAPRDDPDAPTDGSYDPRLYTLPYQYDNEVAQQYEQEAPAQVAPQRPRKKSGRRQQGARALGGFQAQQYQQPQSQFQAQPQPQYQSQSQQYQPQTQQYQPQPQQYQPQPQQYQQQQPQYQPQAPQPVPFNQAQAFQGHPARNIDINTGSYSLNYSG